VTIPRRLGQVRHRRDERASLTHARLSRSLGRRGALAGASFRWARTSEIMQRNGASAIWCWLLLLPFLALLFPGLYARTSPELWGFPFFYWYQFAWVIASALITWLVYVRTR